MGNLKTERVAQAKIVFFDVDGVFTDGKAWQDTSGQWRRSFSVRDTMGVRALRKAGVKVAIVTSALSSEIRSHFDYVGVDALHENVEGALVIAQILKTHGLSHEDALFVNENDAGGVQVSGHQTASIYSSSRLSGDGAVLEISNLILQHRAAPKVGIYEIAKP